MAQEIRQAEPFRGRVEVDEIVVVEAAQNTLRTGVERGTRQAAASRRGIDGVVRSTVVGIRTRIKERARKTSRTAVVLDVSTRRLRELAVTIEQRVTAQVAENGRPAGGLVAATEDDISAKLRRIAVGVREVAYLVLCADVILAKDDVHHTCHRVRAVNGRSAVLEDFDALDGRERNRIQVDEGFGNVLARAVR